MDFLDENAVVEVSALYNVRGLVDAVMGLLGTFLGAPNPPKKASKWVPKTVLKNEPQKASQKAPLRTPTWGPQGVPKRPWSGRKGVTILDPDRFLLETCHLDPPWPLSGPVLGPGRVHFGASGGLFWGPFGLDLGSMWGLSWFRPPALLRSLR